MLIFIYLMLPCVLSEQDEDVETYLDISEINKGVLKDMCMNTHKLLQFCCLDVQIKKY